MTKAKYFYRPTKPVRYADMGDYRWCYVEAPKSLAQNMGGIPISAHEFGLIATEKMILPTLRDQIGLEPVAKRTP